MKSSCSRRNLEKDFRKMPCRLSKTVLLFVKNYLLNRVSYAFSSKKLSFLNEKAIFPQRESIADSTKNMAFLRKKGRFSLHKKRLACITASTVMIYGCTRQIGVFKSDGKKFLAAPVLRRQRFSKCKRLGRYSRHSVNHAHPRRTQSWPLQPMPRADLTP